MGDKRSNAYILSTDIQLQPHQHGSNEIDTSSDSVYFTADSSSKSFTGCLNDCMEDDEVVKYIKLNNVALHDRLWGARPIQSSSQGTLVSASQADVKEDVFLFLDSGADTLTANYAFNGSMSQNAPANGIEDGIKSQNAASTDSANDYRGSWSDFIELPEGQIMSTSTDVCESESSFSEAPTANTVNEHLASVERTETELTQDLRLLQLRRYIQSLLLSE